ncbi:hypothetical protein J1605_011298 [Eschrichtius robustus]|uniref:C-type lectin domain-containing protein n=1 Tax=Eschrichtius robustus TaxID=9764 RepID=A0AB34GPG9_ESCRO|nr:hypothetical protein J1605_011298 [Eschrichtius robustus]
MRGDEVRFCTGNQSVSLCSRGLDPRAVAPAAPKMSRRLQATLAVVAVTVVSSLVALFVVEFPEDNSTGQFLKAPEDQLLQLILQGWKSYSGSLYYFSHAKKTWQEAEQFCVSQGAHLASVTSEEEQAFLIQFTSASYHWIGLTDSGLQGFWRWTDGTPFNSARSSAFWDKNQPDNWRHGNGLTEDCVHMQRKWNDMYCTALYHWVCKKPVGRM